MVVENSNKTMETMRRNSRQALILNWQRASEELHDWKKREEEEQATRVKMWKLRRYSRWIEKPLIDFDGFFFFFFLSWEKKPE